MAMPAGSTDTAGLGVAALPRQRHRGSLDAMGWSGSLPPERRSGKPPQQRSPGGAGQPVSTSAKWLFEPSPLPQEVTASSPVRPTRKAAARGPFSRVAVDARSPVCASPRNSSQSEVILPRADRHNRLHQPSPRGGAAVSS